MRIFLSIAMCVILLPRNGQANFVVEKNSLKITSPASLRGTYECAIGNFGIPQYGGTMMGMLSLPRSNTKACKDFSEFGLTFKPRPGIFPTFALVDRGGQILNLLDRAVRTAYRSRANLFFNERTVEKLFVFMLDFP